MQTATEAMLNKVSQIGEVQGPMAQQITEIHLAVLGMSKTQQSLAVLMFMVAEQVLQMPKSSLAKTVAMETEDSLEALLTAAAGSSGKG